jgi:hypothetical protein
MKKEWLLLFAIIIAPGLNGDITTVNQAQFGQACCETAN